MEEETYVETDSQWKQGAALDYYNQEISIVAANAGNDGKIYMKWVYSQTKDRKPSEKMIPLKITLGDSGTAISILEDWIEVLRNENPDKSAKPSHKHENKKPTDESDVPF